MHDADTEKTKPVLRINPECRLEKADVFSQLRIQRIKVAFAEQAAWGKSYWSTGNQ